MTNNDIQEEAEDGSNSFIDTVINMHKWHVEAMVYMARHQGLRAGVRPNTEPPQPSDEEYPPVRRVVFIEFPEKTKEWGFTEIPSNTTWLDSLPQYDN